MGCHNQRALKDHTSLENREPAKRPAERPRDLLSAKVIMKAAWAIKNIGLGLGPQCQRMLAVMNVFELRSRLRQAFDKSTAHVQNAFFLVTTIFAVQEAQRMPLGEIALRLRSSMIEQTSEQQVEALVRGSEGRNPKVSDACAFCQARQHPSSVFQLEQGKVL